MSTARQAAAWTYRVLIPLVAAAIPEVFHALNAVLVLGLVLFLAVRGWRGNRLIPPAQLLRTAPAPMPAAPMPVPALAPKERVQ